MDKKLLQALDNLSFSLEMIAEALQSGEASSNTSAALQSGDFVKQIQEINEGVKSIKVDTQQILKNQQTIIELSKKKEADKKTGEFEGASDPKKESAIKKGVSTILLIAVAVLAIGMAFKLVGDINVLSVIGLALAITIVSIAFEKVAKLDLSIKQAAIASLTMVMMSFAITASSWILGLITPVSFLKMLTATIIATGFTILGGSIAKMIRAFEGLSWGEVIKAVVFLPLILPAIALGIALASSALQLVQPIGLSQFFSSILIAGIFAVVSYGVRNMIRAFDGISPKEAIVAALFLPIILPAISLAIALASETLQLVQPVGLIQWFTSVLISLLFVVLSFGVARIINAFKGMDPATLLTASIGIPVILVAMAAAIWGASELLAKVVPIGFFQFLTAIGIAAVFVVISYGIKAIAASIGSMKWSDIPKIPVFFVAIAAAIMASSLILQFTADLSGKQLFTIAALGLVLTGIAFAMGAAMKFVGKISLKDLLVGSLGLVIIATTIMLSSLILSVGNYDTYPTLSWITGVALSLTTFGLAAWILGTSVFGPQALVFLAGLGAVIAVAGTIVAVSKILSYGKYDNKGMLDWAKSTALLYATFTPAILILGAMGLAGSIMSFFGAEDPFETAKRYMIQIAETIVSVSKVLKKGTYEGGPTKAWAEGIAISLGAFMPVYDMLMTNSILSMFGGGGVGPDDFTKAILTVSDGIITAADKFAGSNAAFKNGPPVEWAEGVGKAISAFSPVYKVLAEESGWFVDGPSVEDMKNAILTISDGIIVAAGKFAESSAVFDPSKVPSVSWGRGVGSALSAFSPVFEMLAGKSWYQSSSEVINSMSSGIKAISRSIVEAGRIFAKSNPSWWEEGKAPTRAWGKGVGAAINAFSGVFEYMSENSGWFTSGEDVIDNMVLAITKVTKGIAEAGRIISKGNFTKKIDPNFIKALSGNIKEYLKISKYIKDAESESSSWIDILMGRGKGSDPIVGIANGMLLLANSYDKLATSFDRFSRAIDKIDVDKLKQLNSINNKSLGNKIEKISPSEKEESGIWSKQMKSDFSGPAVKSPTGGVKTTTAEDKRSLSSDMKKIIDLLSGINRSTSLVNDYLSTITDEKLEPPKEL